jgi:uncharacterized membrane protein YesL
MPLIYIRSLTLVFDYDGFLVKMLVKAGNMMIVSFLWLISCIPIITIIPATAAMFHTTTKVIRQSGTGVVRDFFTSLGNSLKKGVPLSLICIVLALLLYTALNFGAQMWQESIVWAIYYVFGFFLAFIFITMLLFVPPTLSRFESGSITTIWLSLYLASRNIIRTIWFLILLGLISLLVYIYPITILILPGLYYDLICGGMEKTLQAFIRERGLEEDGSTGSESGAPADDTLDDTEDIGIIADTDVNETNEMTGLELDRLFGDSSDEDINIGDNNE